MPKTSNLDLRKDKENTKKFQKSPKNNLIKGLKIVGVTACPTGVAHTYMAAKALTNAAQKMGHNMICEKQAAAGVETELSVKNIEDADLVIIAAGKKVSKNRFSNKKLYEVPIGNVLKNPEKIIQDAIEKGIIFKSSSSFIEKQRAKTKSEGILTYLMNGVSYMIPFVVCGGLMLAFSFGFGATLQNGKWIFRNDFWQAMNLLGGAAFTLMIPILGGYIAYAIADRAALAPAMIGSFIGNVNSGGLDSMSGSNYNPFLFDWAHLRFGVDNAPLGFIGAIAIGLFVGYLILWMKKIKNISWMKPVLPIIPIIILPVLGTLITWVVLAFIIGTPFAFLTQGLNTALKILAENNLFWILAPLLGAMIAFDMGGPINKIAFLLGASYINAPPHGHPEIMGAIAAAIAVPPLGLSLAIFVDRIWISKTKYKTGFDDIDYQTAKGSIILSIVGITEGAIPFAVRYPRLIIANILGGIVASSIAASFLITDAAAHGGPIVYLFGAIGYLHVGANGSITWIAQDFVYGLLYIMAILIGGLVTCFSGIGLMIINKKKSPSISNSSFNPITQM